MQETPISFLQIDTPPGGATLPPGRHAVQGWLMPRLRGGFADLRVSIDDRVFPGLLGFPRTDLAAHFKTGRPRELAGFQVNVELAPGPRRLVFEALQIEGVWQEVGVLKVMVDGSAPPVDFAVPTAPVRGREFGHLLHLLLTEASPTPNIDALAHGLVNAAPFPRDLLRPKPPFHGALKTPEAIEASPEGFLEVRGHLFHASSRIRHLAASVDLHALQPLDYGAPTPDIGEKHPRSTAARECGFSGKIFVANQLPNPIALRLYATLADGSVQLVHVARVQRQYAGNLTRAFAPAAREQFEDGVTALRCAIAARELALVTDATYDEKVSRLASLTRQPPPQLLRSPRFRIDETFAHPPPEGREMRGLPVDAWIVAAACPVGESVLSSLFLQAADLLAHRYPGLAGTCHFLLERDPRPADHLAKIADLVINPAEPNGEDSVEPDPVALAEAIACRLLRRSRNLGTVAAGPP